MCPAVEKHVFISYASADRPAAERVRDDLESDGIACWMAPRDVPPGADYATAITDAIGSCRVLLLLFSASAAASDHIEREVHLAVSAKAVIVPLRLEPLEPVGSLKYLLANVQRIDAFPRLEPQLRLLSAEIRRVLPVRAAASGPTRRSPFQHVLAAAGAWAVVIGFEVLLLEWIRRVWFNLVSFWSMPVEILRAPALAFLLAIPLIAALALQYLAHRNLNRIATLDALFAVSAGGGARVRLGGSACLWLGAAIAIVLTPATVTVRLADGKIEGGDSYLRARNCLPSASYTVQSANHYAVDLRVGSRNPPGKYMLRAELMPYATADGVEFCEVWLDRSFGVTRVTPMSDDQRSSGYVEVEGAFDLVAVHRSLLFNVRHYRDSEPSPLTTVTASATRGPVQATDDEPIALPLR
ncbi:MAG: TIR domain-containing protein [Luteitalea sp.]|nr:TIR domain-containing protein [Luteitalea sp.]